MVVIKQIAQLNIPLRPPRLGGQALFQGGDMRLPAKILRQISKSATASDQGPGYAEI